MSENSINVKNVSKKFRLYHQKRTTLYESIIGSINRKPHYETLQVLDNVSFNVKKGESFGIVGRNGSGKTTTRMNFESSQCDLIINDKLMDFTFELASAGGALQWFVWK